MRKAIATTFGHLAVVSLAGIGGLFAGGCTEEEAKAILAGIEVAADQLNQEDEVSFRDWIASELDD